jgi:hypothetical protein
MVLPYVIHSRTVCHPLEDTPWWNNLPLFLHGAAGLLGDVGGFLPVLSCGRPSSHSHRPHRQVLLLCPREILRHTVRQAPSTLPLRNTETYRTTSSMGFWQSFWQSGTTSIHQLRQVPSGVCIQVGSFPAAAAAEAAGAAAGATAGAAEPGSGPDW